MAAAILIAHHFEQQQQEQQQMNKLAADKEILMRQKELASEVKDNNNNDDNQVANASDDENKINENQRSLEKSAQIMTTTSSTKVDKRPPKLVSLSSLSTMMMFANNEPVQANDSQFVRTSCSPALKLNIGSQPAAANNHNHRKNILPNKLTLKSVGFFFNFELISNKKSYFSRKLKR